MFIVREFVQECKREKELIDEFSFMSRENAEIQLRHQYDELLKRQENYPGVWSRSFDGIRYTVDNNDGDFFEGVIVGNDADK